MIAESLSLVNSQTVLDVALAFAATGVEVVPVWTVKDDGTCQCGDAGCPNPGKHPNTLLVPHGARDRTTDPHTINTWFKLYPQSNLAVCGSDTFKIVDFDDASAYYAWAKEQPELAKSLTVLSGSGDGYHVYLTTSEECPNYNHAYGEVRGTNQYAVCPPSRHVSGNLYQFVRPAAPILCATPEQLPERAGIILDDSDIAEINFDGTPNHRALEAYHHKLPAWVLKHIGDPQKSDDRSEADWATIKELVRAGATNIEIWSVFETQPVGQHGKYGEKTPYQRRRYLARSIAKAQKEIGRETSLIKTATISGTGEKVVLDLGVTQEQLRQLLSCTPDDDGNALSVLALYPTQFVWTEAWDWLVYNGKYWQRSGAEARINRAIIETFKKRRTVAAQLDGDAEALGQAIIRKSSLSTTNMRSCLAMLQTHVGGLVTASDFDQHDYLLNVQNGVVNLQDGTLQPHDPDLRFTYCLDVEFNPATHNTEWENFLRGALRNDKRGVVGASLDELLQWLQMAVGYCLTGSTKEEIFFYIHGPERSGKGTFTETMLSLLGKPLAAGADFQTFTADSKDANNFDLAGLKAARFITATESSQYDWLNKERLKRMTGGDTIRASEKHKPFFEFTPQWKFWLTSNYPAKGDPDDNALWWRARVIEFPNSHSVNPDKDLKYRLRTPESLSGILTWAVTGAVLWHKQGLGIPQAIRGYTDDHRALVDYVQRWLEDTCVLPEEGDPETYFLPSRTLYDSYSEWCKENTIQPKNQVNFLRSLEIKGFDVGAKKYVEVEGGRKIQKRGVCGIKATYKNTTNGQLRIA